MHQTLGGDDSACWTSACRERLDEIGKKIKREPDTAALALAAASTSTAPAADNRAPRRLGLGLGGGGDRDWERGRSVALPVPDLRCADYPGDRAAEERRASPAVPPVGAGEGARPAAPEAGDGPVG